MKRLFLNINRPDQKFVADRDRVLLDLLRDDLGLAGAKQASAVKIEKL